MADASFRTIHEIVKQAHLRLNRTHWDYLVGGTETETTLRRNRLAIDRRALRPRVLNDVSEIDPAGRFLGQDLTIPVALAPIGSLQVFESGGGATATRAAEEFGVMSIASSVCEPGLEAIAEASGAPKIYQLYVRGDADWTDDIVRRAVDAGYVGFCLTVDTAVVSRRERDIAKRVVPTSQPAEPGDIRWQARLNWSDVERIKAKFDIPLILKGINRVDDALHAVNLGVVYVSNHGGRQLDQGPGTLDILPEIVAAVDGRAEIAVDGGFYRGTDILKAIAMGANVVGLGRLQGWAMAAGGQAALTRCLNILKWEIEESLALCGVTCFDDLDASFIDDSWSVTAPSVFSAFPLLNLEDDGY